jgi:hypothetical protein
VWVTAIPFVFEGYAMFVALGSRENNPTPYPPGSPQAKAWLTGWDLAFQHLKLRAFQNNVAGTIVKLDQERIVYLWRTLNNSEPCSIYPSDVLGLISKLREAVDRGAELEASISKLEKERGDAMRLVETLRRDLGTARDLTAPLQKKRDQLEAERAEAQSKADMHWAAYVGANALLKATLEREKIANDKRAMLVRENTALRNEIASEGVDKDWKKATKFTIEQIVRACRNVGIDLDCGACASLFFTGAPFGEHTCRGCRYCIHRKLEMDQEPCRTCKKGVNWPEFKQDQADVSAPDPLPEPEQSQPAPELTAELKEKGF